MTSELHLKFPDERSARVLFVPSVRTGTGSPNTADTNNKVNKDMMEADEQEQQREPTWRRFRPT